jgi:hypothetical protein
MNVIIGTMAKRVKSEKASVAPSLPIPSPSNASEVPSVYSNIVEVLSMNHIDIRIAFNEVTIEGGNNISTLRRANVVMSVPTFLTMVQILNANAKNLVASQNAQAEAAQAYLQAQIEAGRTN